MLFSKGIPKGERRSDTRIERSERGIWQRRYWEHLIRDELDYQAHVDYVHINPLKRFGENGKRLALFNVS